MPEKKFFKRIKPGVPKRYLLLIAAILWLAAGGILVYRGEHMLPDLSHFWNRFIIALVSGLGLFFLFFIRISLNHIRRIKAIEILRPCIFSFFDIKGYLMMAVMISLGIILRATKLVDPEILGYFYITMGIPLLLSSVRFYLAWRRYNSIS